MIRPFTTLCLIAACGSGLYLYGEKHRAELLDRDIAHVIRQTQAAHERTGLLRAEWALLNEPGRLQELAGRYLHLQPMAPTQFVRLADLATRLPPPEAPKPEAVADDDTPAPDAAPTAAPDAPAAIASADAETDSVAPATLAAAPVAAPVLKIVAPRPLIIMERTRASAVRVAHLAPAPVRPMVHGAPLPLAAARPIGPIAIARASAPAAVLTAVPAVHSMIGGGGSLPPPVPLKE